uniref:Retrotransposon gag domain-containing protein n=2 Tax=Cajanus cajan TaxID=3821 RepID=A0A151R1G3_CAJCA|nr:hypothetical protein KK1_042536 [Cajanus cajan]
MNLERGRIHTWKDLAEAFLKQYKYNMDMAPDRTQLQNMLKKENETFKEYAQRWRGVVSQVQPPLSEKEMVTMFIDTLQSPFYDRMIGNVSSNFSDLVVIGGRVEMGVRTGKIAHSSTGSMYAKKPSTNTDKKRGGETNAVMSTSIGSNRVPFAPSHRPQYMHNPKVAAVSLPPYPQHYQFGMAYRLPAPPSQVPIPQQNQSKTLSPNVDNT